MFIIIDKYGGTSDLNDSTEKQIAEISIAFLIKSDLNKLIHFI